MMQLRGNRFGISFGRHLDSACSHRLPACYRAALRQSRRLRQAGEYSVQKQEQQLATFVLWQRTAGELHPKAGNTSNEKAFDVFAI